jgi:cytochrome c oxidase subunit 3
MEIPYTASVRPDTGVTNQKLGMWLFLASEVMLFGSLFSSYALLRSGATAWPDQSSIVNVRLAAINTVVLITSSVTIVRSGAALRS